MFKRLFILTSCLIAQKLTAHEMPAILSTDHYQIAIIKRDESVSDLYLLDKERNVLWYIENNEGDFDRWIPLPALPIKK